MGMLAALAVGYVVGARAGSKDLDQVTRALKALSASDEFADVLAALRSHVGHTLRELGGMIEGGPRHDGVGSAAPGGDGVGDLVDEVRQLFGR